MKGVQMVIGSAVLVVTTADIPYLQFIISSACFDRSFENHGAEKCEHKREKCWYKKCK
jgi:hypothetical protein